MEPTHFIGIDPGLDGAFAISHRDTLRVVDMPTFLIKRNGKMRRVLDLGRIVEILKAYPSTTQMHAMVEDVHSSPVQSPTAAFSFGFSVGAIQGILTGLGISHQQVSPQQWKGAYRLLKQDKDASRMKASQLMPQHAHNWPLKKHDGRAEAALLARLSETWYL